MTRITNDVQALIELLMGLGALIGQFMPFFIALFVMFAINAELALYLLGAIPLFVVVTYFSSGNQESLSIDRNTVSQLNQNLQENHPHAGRPTIKRENFNLNVYEGINNSNRKHEFMQLTLSLLTAHSWTTWLIHLAVIIWVVASATLQESVSLGSVIFLPISSICSSSL